ncbi:MAG: hypothetical protein Q8T09_00685 [Candidatus Melainabacteria bacterium]|nr:hypothetical protein [Candidatus Melainabacteria bacterium]
MSKLKLFHNNDCIGVVTNIAPEDIFEFSGDIRLTKKAQEYKEVFDYLSDENNACEDGIEIPFPQSCLENWSLVDESGSKTEIAYPVVCDGEVFWHGGAATYIKEASL